MDMYKRLCTHLLGGVLFFACLIWPTASLAQEHWLYFPLIIKAQPDNVKNVPQDGSLGDLIDQAQPGDVIQLASGVYHQSVLLTEDHSGTADAYITIQAAPGAEVIFDGSDPTFNNGNDNWTLYQSTSQNNIYYRDIPWGSTNSCGDGTSPGYVGELFNGRSTRYQLFDSEDSWDDFIAQPPGKAYYVCHNSGPGPQQRLYVVTYTQADPDTREMYVSKESIGFYFRGADYIRLDGITFRHYSLYGVYLSIQSGTGSDANIIENSQFYGLGETHLRLKGDANKQTVGRNIIQNNTFAEYGYRDSSWDWPTAYGSARADVIFVALLDAAGGNIIQYNTFENGHDAITVSRGTSNVQILNNTIRYCMDDAIEVDNNPGQNILIQHNYIWYCYVAISLQDWNASNHGPVYILRNVIIGGDDPLGRIAYDGSNDGYVMDYAFKVGSDQTPDGNVYIYHNTISVVRADGRGRGIQNAGGTYFANTTTRNNIWHVTGQPFYLTLPQATQNLDFNCDNIYKPSTSPSSLFTRWSSSGGPNGNGLYYDLPEFQSYINQESQAISAESLFDDAWHLQAGSPNIDAGCLIPGINDDYAGAAPDIGAFEFQP